MSESINNLFLTTSCFLSAEMEVMPCLMALSSGLDLLGLSFSNGWRDSLTLAHLQMQSAILSVIEAAP